jgi:Icc-related predicted phosphoesterase
MRIVAISDTHTKEREALIPDGDVIVHAGDFTYRGRKDEVVDFLDWFLDLPHKHKVLIAGNHDVTLDPYIRGSRQSFFEENDDSHWIHRYFFDRIRKSKNVHYLDNSGVTIEGLNFWGSAATPKFGYGWAFNYDRGPAIDAIWEKIPENTDILITHGPPFGVLDSVKYGSTIGVGCSNLSGRISERNIKAHFFGHIHESYGHSEVHGVHYFNCCFLDDEYYASNTPWVVDVKDGNVSQWSNRI